MKTYSNASDIGPRVAEYTKLLAPRIPCLYYRAEDRLAHYLQIGAINSKSNPFYLLFEFHEDEWNFHDVQFNFITGIPVVNGDRGVAAKKFTTDELFQFIKKINAVVDVCPLDENPMYAIQALAQKEWDEMPPPLMISKLSWLFNGEPDA